MKKELNIPKASASINVQATASIKEDRTNETTGYYERIVQTETKNALSDIKTLRLLKLQASAIDHLYHRVEELEKETSRLQSRLPIVK